MPFNVNWSDFWPNSRSEMRDDHDLIVVDITHNVQGVSGVRISVSRALNVTWWKGFRLVEANGKEIAGIFGGQDADYPAEHDFSMADIAKAARLEIWKAKTLGFHTHTYTLADLTPLQPGTVIEFYWAQDTGGIRNADMQMALFSGVRDQDNQARTFTVTAGAQFQLETRVVNNITSTIAFDPRLDFWIGSQNPQDNMSWGNNRWSLGGSIPPDQGRNVTLNFTAPTQPGSYPLALRMVQDGVTWFGNTFQFTANVVAAGGGGGGGTPGRTCLLTSLAVCLGMLNQSPDKVLDGARIVRTELQKSESGRQLVQSYVALSEAQELVTLIAADPALLKQCLSLAASIANHAHHTPAPELLPTLAGKLPQFERILEMLDAQSSEPTRAELAEVRRLTREIAVG